MKWVITVSGHRLNSNVKVEQNGQIEDGHGYFGLKPTNKSCFQCKCSTSEFQNKATQARLRYCVGVTVKRKDGERTRIGPHTEKITH